MNINFNHLYYFWVTANEGGISKAAKSLHLTPQTVSAQIASLEQRLERKLFEKRGRTLALTDYGVLTKVYADEMFNKANEWMQTIQTGEQDWSNYCRVGITDGLPKSLVSMWLTPLLDHHKTHQVDCQDGSLEELIERQCNYEIDLILTELPMPSKYHLNAHCERIGTSPIGLFSPEPLATKISDNLPHSLDQKRFVMPGLGTPLCMQLEQWFEQHHIAPTVSMYASDIALMKTLGRDGFGSFAAPLILKQEIMSTFEVSLVCEFEHIKQDYFAITPKRSFLPPIVKAIVNHAKKNQ
ncbi:LysR family transcriptional regulator [Thalassotalea aquiviva]|uniref:LysR family transcriptional regulator n=1 Tax=Thalassotalea aquiviva TaxID=3242415 RepID=UPI00352AEF06